MKNIKTKSKKVTLESLDARFGGLNTRLESLDARFGGLDTRLSKVGTRLSKVETKVDDLNLSVGVLTVSTERKFQEIEEKMLTKSEFYSFMDPLAKSIDDLRQENKTGFAQYRRHSDAIQDHEQRIQKLESHKTL